MTHHSLQRDEGKGEKAISKAGVPSTSWSRTCCHEIISYVATAGYLLYLPARASLSSRIYSASSILLPVALPSSARVRPHSQPGSKPSHSITQSSGWHRTDSRDRQGKVEANNRFGSRGIGNQRINGAGAAPNELSPPPAPSSAFIVPLSMGHSLKKGPSLAEFMSSAT